MKESLLVALLLCVLYSFFSFHHLLAGENDQRAQLATKTEEPVNREQVPTPWKTSARACERRPEAGLYKSQSAEDKHLLKWFSNLCNGTYAEMGGLDGVTYSNTHVFNKGLDWKGVLVELGPKNFAKMQRNRPNELATVHAAVCEKRQTIHYVESEAWSGAVGGIWEFMAPSFRARWHRGKTLNNTTPVECKPLKDIFNESVGENFYFDFFTLDIEGAEYEAVASLDFTKVGFGVIVVEADGHNQRKNMAVRTLMERSGYTYLYELERSYWFVNKDFDLIYKDLFH